ncbi:MAG: hypothetical protein QXQ53_06520 [Candidatus Methanosuratincola sp.]
MGLKLSRFAIAIALNDKDILLVNTLNHAMIRIPSQLLDLAMGFLIDEDVDEIAVARYELPILYGWPDVSRGKI